MLVLESLTSPNVVVAVSSKLTVTAPLLGWPGLVFPPDPFAPVWIATALRAGTVALNEPPETVKLAPELARAHTNGGQARDAHEDPVQLLPEEVPLMTSQYAPSGREVEKVDDQAESALLIATKPSAPVRRKLHLSCSLLLVTGDA